MTVVWLLAVFGLVGGNLFIVHPAQADDEEKVTVVSGTDAADTMMLADPIDAQADLTTDESEKIEASATALDALAGNDVILSDVAVNANADATALLLQILDAKTQALAKSLGLAAGDDDDTLTSNASLAVTSVASGAYGSSTLGFDTGDREGGDRKIDLSLKTEAASTAMDAGDGDDTVNNGGELEANATATSGGMVGGVDYSLSAEAQGAVSLTSKSSAKAETTGIATGEGDDQISSTNTITSIATATSGALGLSLAAGENAEGDKAKTELDVSAEAEATAIGIESDGDDAAEEDKEASPFGLDGLRVTYAKETTAVSGMDSLINSADVQVIATATSGAGSASMDVAVDGTAQTKANSEAKAESIGLSTGAAQDTIINSGDLNAVATATAGALSATFQIGAPTSDEDPPPTTDSTSDNNSSSQSDVKTTARVVGIASDGEGQFKTISASAEITDTALVTRYQQSEGTVSGDDRVANSGDIIAVATATAGAESAAIDIAAGGSIESKTNATATAESVAIFTGGGDDTIINTGALDAIATATSGALSVGLSVAEPQQGDDTGSQSNGSGSVKSESEVTATANAKGIDAEGNAQSKTLEVNVDISRAGIVADFTKSQEAASGNDTVSNQGSINAVATATSGSESASIDIAAGSSVESKANATATSDTAAIFTGSGDDEITNTGALDSISTATAGALSIGLAVAEPQQGDDTGDESNDPGSVKSETEATTTATARGIDAEGDAQSKSVEVDVDISRSGIAAGVEYRQEAALGNDTVDNQGNITSVATATSGSESASIDIAAGGSVESKANATATSESIAIFTGGGDDAITNTGALDAVATATSNALSIGLAVAESQGDDTGDDSDDSGSVKSETEAKATATARGIDSEGGAQSKSVEADVDISRSGIAAGFEYSQEAASGNDRVDNQASISAVSTATSGSESAAIDIMAGGSVESKANAEATSESVAIFTGGGDDTVSNTGALDAVATSTAGAISVSLGVSDSSSQDDGGILDNLRERLWPTVHSEANATATATARGIDTEGGAEDKSTAGDLSLDRQSLNLLFAYDETQASGHDHVANDGAINAVATATSGAGAADIQVNSDGTAAAEANSTATAQADAIRTGGGDDTVNNSGTLTAVATATSGALSVGVSHADGDDTKARAEAKATSTAQATGIDTEGDNDSREVDFSLDLSREGLHVNYNDTQTAASGNDEVVNQAAVTTVATASSGAAAIPVSIDGAASADVTSKATAAAMAIHTGGGHDVIDNSGVLTAASQATSAAIGVGFGQQTQSTGKTKVEVKAAAESTASAMGIATDGDAGDQSTAFSFSLTNEGLVSGFSKSQTAIAGDDTLTNTGIVTTTATASSGAAGVAVAIDGAAAVDISSTTNATATGVDTGGGDDHIDNQGTITSTATATSIALGVGVGVQNGSSSKASSNVEAAAKSEALAVGITADGNQQDTALEIDLVITEDGLSAGYHQSQTPVAGDDDLINIGAVTAVATATSGAGAVGVTTEGSARSDASATAKADARALDVGGGSDTVDNRGALSAVSTATVAAVEVSVSGKGTTIANNGIFSAGTTAEAQAVGIAGTDAASAETLDITLDVDFNDVSAGFVFEKVVDGIEGDGDDTITNTAGITTVATATAPEVSVAVTSEGIAASLASTEATAEATAIQSGHGDDSITTSGNLSATATATAAAVNVAVTGKGLAVAGNSVWDGGTKADAQAAGIQSEGGERNTLAIAVDASLEGVAVAYEKNKELASGEDTVVNDGNIAATAVAVAPEVSVAVSSQGVAASLSTSTATSEAFGIRTGDAGDDITNRGNITAVANADAVAVNVAVAPTGGSVAGNNFWDGGTKAETSAFGIDADGETASETQTRFTADGSGAAFTYDHQEILASGDDVIRNDGDVTAVAVSVAPALSVAVTAEGVAAALSTATATSDARAIRGGDGEDIIENTGNLTAVSNADAFAVNVSVVPTGGVSAAGNNFWDGGNKAEALAIGIDGDGENFSTSEINVDVNGAGVGIERSSSNQMAGGDDRIVNSGDMDITAVAVSPSIATAVTVAGVSAAISTAKATSDARAIRGGDGSDTIENTGNLTVFSNADAAAVNVSVNAGGGVALASDAIWDGGTTAEAKAFGIDAEGESSSSSTTSIHIDASVSYDQDKTEDEATGDDIVNNQGDIDVLAIAVAPSVAVSVVGTGGVAGAFSTATAKADSTAISTGAGDDTITNSGALSSTTVANADAVSVSVTGVGGVSVSGNNVWDGGTKSEAKSRGIDSGIGDDELENDGEIIATATAVTANASVSVTGVGGVAGAISTSTANAESTAVDTGDGDDTITNTGGLDSVATAIAASVNVSVTGVGGVSVSGNNAWDGGTKSEAKSRGIDSGDGDDTLENSGNISTLATTVAASGAVSVVGVGGGAGALSTATATTDSAAIDTGSGEDVIINSGMLTADAFATGDAVNVAVTGVGGVSGAGNDVWDGGTLSEAQSRGVTSGEGDDRIDNSGDIATSATTVTGTGAVSVTGVGGVSGAISTATATSDSAAIATGEGNDTIINSGALSSNTSAIAAAVNVSVTGVGGVSIAGNNAWDGGTLSEATSRGIDSGEGDDNLTNSGDVSVSATTVTATGSVSVTGVGGVSGAVSTSTAKSDAVAIAMGAGEDEVDNSGVLNANAFANADGLNVAVTGVGGVSVAGNNAWDGGTLAEAQAAGIDGRDGEARITNTNSVTAGSEAVSVSAALSYVTFGVPLAISTSTADAEAAAIRSGDQDDTLTNSGALTAETDATAVTVNVAVTGAGVVAAGDSVWDGGTKAKATSVGMDARAGEDIIHNFGTIDIDADAVTSSTSVAFTVAGVSGAVSTSTATADAQAISGGDGDDTLINEGALDSTADATAVSVSFAASGAGVAIAADAVWDGGTTAEAHASGLDGGLGDDVIQNTAQVDATANSTASSNSVAMTVAGVSGATSTATSTAVAAAIDAGAGNDVVRNDGGLSSIADAGATSVSVAVTGAGGALAGDSFWDGGTKATADAAGITLGDGNDTVVSTNSIDADATASATSVAVAASFTGGLAGAVAASTASAQATGMQAGTGDDLLVNTADVTATTLSEAQGVSVSFTPVGASVAGAYVDNATTANALSIGLAGDSGEDVITNEANAEILLEAQASTTDTAVALSLAGLSAAESTAIASAGVVGLDGGDDNDTVVNSGTIRSDLLHADAIARAVAFTALGLGDATANALGSAAATGISGGSGGDWLENAGVVDLNPHASSIGQSIGVAVGGAAIGEANADALVEAVGIEGGVGEDTIMNTGDISLDALASTTARSIAASAVGYSLGQANSNATASVAGLVGGEDDDAVVNAESGHISLLATADTVATSVSITVAGAADGEARTLPKATAIGLTGDGGNDLVVNQGALEVLALSRSSASTTSISVAGFTSAKAGTEVETTAIGMSGGEGEDILMNTGILRVGPADGATGDARWMSLLDTEASSFGFAGSTNAESAAFARTTSMGMSGGDDDDQIVNTGDMTVIASALNRSSSETVNIFGSSGAAGESGAFTGAQGLSGGQGDDRIDNAGNLTVDANAELLLDGSSYTFGGSGDTGGVLAALTRVEGITGGEGEDHITNSGRLDVDARAALTSSGESDATFGGSSASVVSGGQTYAKGITGGEDDDIIENSAGGRVDVRSSTEVTTESIAYTFGGGSGTDAILTGEAVSVGLDGGRGNDRLTSHGVVEVVAEATLQSTGGAKHTVSFTSDSESTGQSVASAQAFGLDGGAGHDTIVTSGRIDVRAEVTAEALNEARSGASITSDNEVGAITQATADAVGLAAGDGDNLIANGSDLTVAADSTAYAFAYASGASISFDGDGLTRAESLANATATGIYAVDGDNTIANTGQMTVTADATTAKRLETSITVYNTGDDTEPIVAPQAWDEDELPRFVDEDGNPLDQNREDFDEGTLLFWTQAPADQQDPNVGTEGAYYIVVVTEVDPDGPDGEEEPFDQWQWELTQQVFAETVTIVEDNFPSYAAANGNGVDGDGHAEGTGTTVAEARGIYLGDGDNVVDNRGDMTVRADAEARFQVSADGDAFGDAIGISQAHAIARAYGIDLGNGNNRVYNDGTIDVTASPIAESQSEVSGGDICIWFFGWWCGGGGDGVGTSNASAYAESLGIHLGDGDNQVINDGTIIATAAPEIASSVNAGADSATVVAAIEAYATGIRAGDGNNVILNNGSIEAYASSPSPPCVNCPPPANQLAAPIQAIGIQTGAGDDAIVNSGEITTSVQVEDVTSAGVAITTGAGNDVVALMPDSAATGSVELGAGDDRLNLVESAVLNGDAMGGAGRDDIVFYGQGAYDGAISEFETAAKYDAGTYTLNSLPTMQSLQVFDGVLRVQDNYLFDETGSALMRIHLEGFGQLWVDDMADLGGSLSVLAEQRAYHNGEVFPIIQSGELVDTFQEVSLPETRQLLRFELNYNDEDEQVEVMARTLPFRTVARNDNERAIADYLDRIAPGATGEMSRVLGEFQTLQGNQFGEAFAGMSPASYGASTGAALNTARMYTQVVTKRMQSLWTGGSTKQADASSYGLDGLLLAYNGPNASLGDLKGRKAQTDVQRRWEAWANVYGQWATQDADDGFVGYDSDTYGIVLGMDYALSETWLAGLSFGYSSNDLDFDTNAGDGDIDSYFGSLYTGWYDDAFYLESVLTYGSQEFDNKRNVVVGATRLTAHSDHDGNLYSAYLGSGYNFGDDVWQVGPFVSLQYLYLDEDSFEESGAGVLNLMVDDRQTDALISQLGVRAARYFDTGLGALVPELSLAWLYDFDIDDRVITSSFAGASGDAFSITGQEVEQNGVVVGAALTLMQANGIESSLSYNGEFRDGYDAHALIGQIRFAF